MNIQTIGSAPGAGTQAPAAPPPAKVRPLPGQGGTADAAVQAAQKPDVQRVQKAAEEINAQLRELAKNIRFSVDQDTGETVVKVVDTETGDVIRQIPSEEMLAISRSLERLQGVLLKQRA
jgi:flagellar protein FlaG